MSLISFGVHWRRVEERELGTLTLLRLLGRYTGTDTSIMTIQPNDSEDFGAAFEAEYLLEFGFKLNVSRCPFFLLVFRAMLSRLTLSSSPSSRLPS